MKKEKKKEKKRSKNGKFCASHAERFVMFQLDEAAGVISSLNPFTMQSLKGLTQIGSEKKSLSLKG